MRKKNVLTAKARTLCPARRDATTAAPWPTPAGSAGSAGTWARMSSGAEGTEMEGRPAGRDGSGSATCTGQQGRGLRVCGQGNPKGRVQSCQADRRLSAPQRREKHT